MPFLLHDNVEVWSHSVWEQAAVVLQVSLHTTPTTKVSTLIVSMSEYNVQHQW
jgi:hypothetical protein